jgi:hypothetical protein
MYRASRPVSLKTRLSIIRQYPLLLIFTAASVMLSVAFFLLYSAIFAIVERDEPTPDYDKIEAEGVTAEGAITDIDTKTNITINNEHPSVIAYSYSRDGEVMHDTFTTLDPDRVNFLIVGDSITVRYLGNASMIEGLKPFEFPFNIFLWIVATPFAIAAVVLIIILLVRTQKIVSLHKYGEIKDATVISITPSGLALARQLEIYYQYTTRLGPVLGKSRSGDHALQFERKYGDTIKVFVSPKDESQSCVVPRGEIQNPQ